MYEELITELREEAEWAKANEWETPIMLSDHLEQAADAIENVSKAYRMMAEAYEAEVTNSRWIPVAERLPEDFQNVLIAFQNGDMAVGFKMTVKTEETILLLWRTMTEEDFCTDCDTPPTHWMPLPTAPKEE